MSLITYNGLIRLIEEGVVRNVEIAQVNAASIDLRLGNSLLIESNNGARGVNLARSESPSFYPAKLTETYREDGNQAGPYWTLWPGEFALANTMENFELPDDVAFDFKLTSTPARGGLGHSLAGWVDPGFNGATLTLELKNTLSHHPLILEPGQRIGQAVFWRGEPVPSEQSYRVKGRYNRQQGAQRSKPR